MRNTDKERTHQLTNMKYKYTHCIIIIIYVFYLISQQQQQKKKGFIKSVHWNYGKKS